MLVVSSQTFVKVLQSVESRRIHRQDLSHAQNQDVRLLLQALKSAFQFVRRTEKERAEYPVDHDTVGDVFTNERVVCPFRACSLIHGSDFVSYQKHVS